MYYQKTFNLTLFIGALIILINTIVVNAYSIESRKNKNVIVLEGSPYDRGLTHARELKIEISEVIQLWKNDIERSYKIDAEDFISQFLKKTNYLPAIKKYTPELLDEVKGIADGSGIEYNTLLTFQLVDEVWLNGSDIIGEHCSALAIHRDGETPSYIAQNMDLEGFRNGYQTVLHIKHENSNLESFVFTCAGLIALNGINNNEVGVCVNAMMQMNYSTKGLPVAFVIRGMLMQASQEEAITFLKKIEHASGQNYIVGGPDINFDFECSAHRKIPFIPYPGSKILYHTNHPLVNDDYNAKYSAYIEKQKDKDALLESNSYIRLHSLKHRLTSNSDISNLDLIKSALSSHDSEEHPICRSFTNIYSGFTFGSTIMVLSENPELHVTFGPSDNLSYSVFKFVK